MRRLQRWLTWLAVACILTSATAVLAQAPTGAVGVYYVGAQDAVAEAIANANPYLVLVDRPELADVYVLNNAPLTSAALLAIRDQALREDVGVVIVSGTLFPNETTELRSLLGVGTFGLATDKRAPRAVQTGEESDPLQEAIAWSSAPDIHARTVISNPNLLLPIVETSAGEPVLQRVRGREQTQVFLVGLWTEDTSNTAWTHWPYFDYLVYRLVAEAADAPRVLSFADYPRSPVPHGQLRLALTLGSIGLILITLIATFLARRALFLRPQALAPIKTRVPTAGTASDWMRVGFHRPLAGLLFQLGSWVILFFPIIIYRTHVLPDTLIPWPQTLDFWKQVTQWANVLWIVFDLSLGVTAMRFFALHRLQTPEEGFKYLQFYIWWQLLSGAIQLALTALLSVSVLPGTNLAHLSFYLMARMLIQFPGFLHVFRYLFLARHRFDYAQLLSILSTGLTILLQAGAAWLTGRWAAQWPDIGSDIGSILGLGIGAYLAEWLVFATGLFLYKAQGHSLRRLFTPAFDREVVGRALGFGARLTIGAAAVPLGYILQIQLMSQGESLQLDWQLVFQFLIAYEILAHGLYDALIPAMTVAHTQRYGTLMRYYASQGIRYGLSISLFLLAVLAGLTDRFIAGILDRAGGPWEVLLAPLLIWGALQWLPWSAEQGLIALGRPALSSWLKVGEVALQLGGIVLLMPRLGLWGLSVAYLGALLLRGLVGWIIAPRLGLRVHVSFWQSVIAPSGAALILYNVIRLAGDLVWTPEPVPTLIFAMSMLLVAIPGYGFLTAFLGGWDDGGIAELKRAMRLSGLGLPVSWLLYRSIRAGATISPLHGRFPVELRDLAEEEAEALTFRRPLL